MRQPLHAGGVTKFLKCERSEPPRGRENEREIKERKEEEIIERRGRMLRRGCNIERIERIASKNKVG